MTEWQIFALGAFLGAITAGVWEAVKTLHDIRHLLYERRHSDKVS